MAANGGYTILDFNNKSFTIGTAQKIDGVYNQIKNNYSKPIILWNLVIGTSAKKAMFLNFDLVNNNYTAQNGDLIFTISSNDNVLISNPEPEVITIEDVIPVVDCGGQSFGNLAAKTVVGAYDKVKNGGPVLFKNFKSSSLVWVGTNDDICDVVVNFTILPRSTAGAGVGVQGNFISLYRSGNSPSYTQKISYVNVFVKKDDKVEMNGTTVTL